LLDEPTEGLDPNQRRDIQSLLAKLRKDRTVIVSSHVLGEISHLADRIIIIHKGQVVGDDSPQHLVSTNKKSIELITEIKGAGVLKGLKGIPGVIKVAKEDSSNHYRLTAKKSPDIREAVFKQCIKNKWVLLEMRLLERQLEDVFSELTEQ
jgi:ABC-2 type transport system ATP-binding protein